MNVSTVTSTPPTGTERMQAYGPFANLQRLGPITAPHRLYYGDFKASFSSVDDAIAAARELSSGSAPAHLVGASTFNEYTTETGPISVYEVIDVRGPRITNPVIGWKPENTTSTPYHIGNVPFDRGAISFRSPDTIPNFRDMVIVDGEKTVAVANRTR